MSDNKKILEVLAVVFAATQNRKLVWKETPSKGVYAAPLPEASILIGDSGGQVFLSIKNAKGDTIETISNSRKAAIDIFNAYDLDSLYATVRKEVLGVDQTFDNIIKRLS